MKVAHRYTMCKSTGFELMLQFPTTAKGRELAGRLVASKMSGTRRARKIIKQVTNGPLSRAMERQKQRPDMAKAIRYEQYLERTQKTKNTSKADNDGQTAIVPINKKSSDSLIILLPKNGNSKKKIKIRAKPQNLTISTSYGELNLTERTTSLQIYAVESPIDTLLDKLERHLEEQHVWALIQDIKAVLSMYTEQRAENVPVVAFAKVIIQCMVANESMASIQYLGCQIFFWMGTKQSYDDKTLIDKDLPLIEAILSSMENHKENDIVQTLATQALRVLLFRNHWTQNINVLDIARGKRLLLALHAAMTNHPRDASIQGNSLIVLQAVACINSEIQDEYESLFLDEGGLIDTALLTHQTNPVVQSGGALGLCLGKHHIKFGSKFVTPTAVRSLASAAVNRTTVCTSECAPLQAFLNLAHHNRSAFFDAFKQVPGAPRYQLEVTVSRDVMSANKTAPERAGIFRYWTGVVEVNDSQDVETHHVYFVDSVAKAMKENAEDQALELDGCRLLDAIAEKSEKAKQYMLRGDPNNEKRFGEMDDLLFAAVQRYMDSPNEVYQAATRLMFKIRSLD